MLESDVIKPVLRWAKKRGIKVLRLTFLPGAEIGWPDHVFLIEGGAPVFVEFKRPGEKPRAIQNERIDYLVSRGYAAIYADNAEEAVDAIEQYRKAGIAALRSKGA